ncbi:MAG: 6-hydroxymethylpterin diphosphokinase MptE-like protein, partial [Phycisphaerales bacterium]
MTSGLSQHNFLEKNLGVLARRSPIAAQRIREVAPSPAIQLSLAPDGGLTGVVLAGTGARQLASRRAPIAEGEALANTVDAITNAAAVVLGFGVGHHVAALAAKLKLDGAVFVYEPDVALLRAVFEQVDCSGWMGASNVVILIDADDTGAMAGATQGLEALLASGTKILPHPPSRVRLDEAADRFIANFTGVMKAVRMMVVTTLVQMDVTVRNLTQNARWYATAAGIRDLKDAAAGRPAIIVAAGPSLRRNIDLLLDPAVRERVVIIAVQTVLKPLLAKGIRPHFVTALDYHEISRRFYEGLSAKDVEGVTLVAEPKCNPAILAAWPGALRFVADDTLDRILGDGLYRPLGKLTPGATVAHLAYYLARHLGCDPAILMGQDLGFTDGQYYSPGASIHQVWSGELNEFNTLEMLEWQRIMRMRSTLREATDHLGRPMYTDEQMSTYLVQFERDFLRDSHEGKLIIDATEGGVAKQHTLPMSLRHALDAYATQPLPALSKGEDAGSQARTRLAQCEERLRELRRSAGKVAAHSRDAGAALRDMLTHHTDQARVNTLIGTTRRMGEEAVREPAYWLVNHINQTGQLNRFKADRAIGADAALAPLERQKREIERDIKNVKWLEDAAHLVVDLLDDALVTLRTGEPKTRDEPPPVRTSGQPTPRVLVCVHMNFAYGGLGNARDLFAPLGNGQSVGAATLARVAKSREASGIVVLTDDGAAARRLVAESGITCEIEVVSFDARRGRAIAAGRAFARHCWRGGVGGLCAYDEVCEPSLLAPLLATRFAEAAACVGADWSLIDPALIDETIARFSEHPEGRPVTFSQAAPGLGCCVVSRAALADMAKAGGPTATIGAVLGY